MQGPTIDRAAERLTVSGWALSDLPTPRLAHLLQTADLTRAEYLAAKDALARRRVHATYEDDAELLGLLVEGKVVHL